MTKNASYFITLCWSLLHRNSKPPSFASTHSRFSLFSNIVGYQTIRIPGNATGAGYSMFTVTFKGVGSEGYSIKDIGLLNKDGQPFDGTVLTSENLIQITKINGDSVVQKSENTYRFNSRVRSGVQVGWHDLTQATKTLDASVKLADGMGVLVTNSQKEDVILRFSGEVEVNPMSFPIAYTTTGAGYSIFGNFTPCAISIKDIKLLNKDKKEFDGTVLTSENLIQIVRIKGDSVVQKSENTYRFNSRVRSGAQVGWHDLVQATKTLDASVTLDPGEAVLVTNSQKEPVYFQLKNPLTGTYAPIE